MNSIKAVLVFLFLFVSNLSFSQKLSPDQISNDLDQVIRGLEIYHLNPYHYQTKENILKKVNEIKANADSMEVVDFWREVDRVLCLVNDAHTRTYPTEYLKAYKENKGTFLPISIELKNDNIYVTTVKGNQNPIQNGDQLIAVNGVAIGQLLNELKENCASETDFLEQQAVVNSFSHYLWESKGWSGPFQIEYVSATNGEKAKVQLDGLIYDQVFNERKKSIAPPYALSFKDDSTAILWFKDFFSASSKEFHAFCKNSFKEINDKKIQHLIIDVRNHNGGDARFANELGKYFAPTPFRAQSQAIWNVNQAFKNTFAKMYIPGIMRWCKPLYAINKHTRAIWKVKDTGRAIVEFKETKPYSNRKKFNGDVYVLIDNGTFSAGSIFAGMVKDYDMATLVGQSTGNLSSFYADPIIWIGLSNSQIRFQISSSYNVRPNGQADDHTIQPDIEIPNAQDALQTVLDLIQDVSPGSAMVDDKILAEQ